MAAADAPDDAFQRLAPETLDAILDYLPLGDVRGKVMLFNRRFRSATAAHIVRRLKTLGSALPDISACVELGGYIASLPPFPDSIAALQLLRATQLAPTSAEESVVGALVGGLDLHTALLIDTSTVSFFVRAGALVSGRVGAHVRMTSALLRMTRDALGAGFLVEACGLKLSMMDAETVSALSHQERAYLLSTEQRWFVAGKRPTLKVIKAGLSSIAHRPGPESVAEIALGLEKAARMHGHGDEVRETIAAMLRGRWPDRMWAPNIDGGFERQRLVSGRARRWDLPPGHPYPGTRFAREANRLLDSWERAWLAACPADLPKLGRFLHWHEEDGSAEAAARRVFEPFIVDRIGRAVSDRLGGGDGCAAEVRGADFGNPATWERILRRARVRYAQGRARTSHAMYL